MKKVLITGISGFAGSFLAENLLSHGYTVEGTYLNDTSTPNLVNKESLNLHKVDLQDKDSTEDLIKRVSPDIIFHLAALASAAESYKNPGGFISNNIEAQVNVLEGVRKAEIKPTILVVSSAEIYGNVTAADLPIDESTSFKPVSPYGVSKVAQDMLGLQYYLSYGLPIITVRPFNHIGPRQAPGFVISSFAKKIIEIEKGKAVSPMKVGNLSAKRDFTDVRDVVEGYRLLIEKGKVGEAYNIGSGKSYLISDMLSKMISMSKGDIETEVDKELLRPLDVEELICDNTKIKTDTGWQPGINIDQSLSDTLDYWRQII